MMVTTVRVPRRSGSSMNSTTNKPCGGAPKRPRSRGINAQIFLFFAVTVLLLGLLTASLVAGAAAANNDDYDDGDDDYEKKLNRKRNNKRIDELRSKLAINLDSISPLDDAHYANASSAAEAVATLWHRNLQTRLARLFETATSDSCRAKIAQHMSYFVNAVALEQSLPFTDVTFPPNECGEPVYADWSNLPKDVHIGDLQNRTYQPPRSNETVYIEDAANLTILYAILTHDNPVATIRLMEALHEPQHSHSFVIHVDGKYDDSQRALQEYAATRNYVHILEDPYRVRVNWGGFTMVNATLQTLKYAFGLLEDNNSSAPLSFHKVVHLSSSSYPLASNPEIRHKLAQYPLDANFLHVIMQPTRPGNYAWHYFVECDDALHRIYQMPKLTSGGDSSTAGVDLFTSSQWFIISRDFAEYLARAEPGSFVAQYLQYIEHVVVADETFFGTVLRHTAYCHKHHNSNFLHLQFDRWESELPSGQRDERKCPFPDPDHCGRSPTIMTLDYADIMELSADLFARKFDDSVDTKVKDVIDQWRAKRSRAILEEGVDPDAAFQMKKVEFEGHGTLIVARDTVADAMPLCLAIGETGNQVELLPCFEDWVPPTLAEHWETGAVILSETVPHTRWEVGPCTSDGNVERLASGEMNVTYGKYSATGPRCMLQQMDGLRAGRCFDGGTAGFQPGGDTQVYPCLREWFQFVSFGDGTVAPKGSLYSTIPSHIVKQIRNLGHEQIPHMCLGVEERGDEDEVDWDDKDYRKIQKERAARKADPNYEENKVWEPLSEWNDTSIVTTQCSNTGAIIEWVFVPFIVEDAGENVNATDSTSSEDSASNDTNSDDQEL